MNFTSVITVMLLALGYPLYGMYTALAAGGSMPQNIGFYVSLSLISVR